MNSLRNSNVSRGGRTARDYTFETRHVSIQNFTDAVALFFSLDSKGGGITDVKLKIGQEDFNAVLAAMIEANRELTLRVVATTLAAELARQPQCDLEVAREARESVAAAAKQAYHDAPTGRDHAERLTSEMVRELVDQLNKPKEESEVRATEGTAEVATAAGAA